MHRRQRVYGTWNSGNLPAYLVNSIELMHPLQVYHIQLDSVLQNPRLVVPCLAKLGRGNWKTLDGYLKGTGAKLQGYRGIYLD